MTIRPATKQEVYNVFRKVCPDGNMPMLFDSDRLVKCDECFAAEIDGQIAGILAMASNGCDSSTGPTLATLYTLRDYRKRGVGTGLCEHGIGKFVEDGKLPIHCDVTSAGMHSTIQRLPPDVQNRLILDLSYQTFGDEFAGREW